MFLDVSMAGIRGLGVLEELQARGLDLAVIVAVDYVEDSSWGSGGSGAIFRQPHLPLKTGLVPPGCSGAPVRMRFLDFVSGVDFEVRREVTAVIDVHGRLSATSSRP
jgi:hypothetical protein